MNKSSYGPELEGRLATQPTVNVLVSAEWIQLRAHITMVLEPFRDAQEVIINPLNEGMICYMP